MLRDKALTPSEALRLTALGILARGPKRYADLAAEVRHFISHITGPSLDLMGSSLELLRYEGLVEAGGGQAHGASHTPPEAELTITQAGRRELDDLLRSPFQGPINDLNKLIIALKMRFLHLLDGPARRAQVDMLIEICEGELARLKSLREYNLDEAGALTAWIDHDIAQVRQRLDWFRSMREKV